MSLVSIIMATYNRAHTLPRAIDSVLAQTYTSWELIIVDDGSTDNTTDVLTGYTDPRIRVLQHQPNRGVAAARNRGLDTIKGEWFTLLDSDDELVPRSLATLIQIPKDVDSRIDAITCNCVDTMTGEFSGKGLDQSQYVSFDAMVSKLSGEHWGITKTACLGALRFNAAIPGAESVLWYRISRHACRYYVHEALRVYHTEGDDRLCGKPKKINIDLRCTYYRELAKETEYLDILRKHRPAQYGIIMSRIALVHVLDGQSREAQLAMADGWAFWSVPQRVGLRVSQALGPMMAQRMLRLVVALTQGRI